MEGGKLEPTGLLASDHESSLLWDGWGRLRPRARPFGAGEAPDAVASFPRRSVWPTPLDGPAAHPGRLVIVPDRTQSGKPRHLRLFREPAPCGFPPRERREPRGRAALALSGPCGHPLGVHHRPVYVPAGSDGGRARHRLGWAPTAGDPSGHFTGPDLRPPSRSRHGAEPHRLR